VNDQDPVDGMRQEVYSKGKLQNERSVIFKEEDDDARVRFPGRASSTQAVILPG